MRSKKERKKIKARESVPLYFSSLSLLRTALHYLNAWNRLSQTPRAIRNVIPHGTLVLCFDHGNSHTATQHKPVHKVWLRSEENEVNDKGGRGGGGGFSLRWGGGGYSPRYVQFQQGKSDVFSLLGFCDIAIDFRQFWSLKGNGLLIKLDVYVRNRHISLLFNVS